MMCDTRRMKGLARFLLLLLLALPAMQARAHQDGAAPGHAMAHEMAMHHGHHRDTPAAPAPHAAQHDCIGCIAPIDIRLYCPAATPQPKAAREPRPADMAFLLTRTSAPEPPPPRASV
jgi:hypothetical protein